MPLQKNIVSGVLILTGLILFITSMWFLDSVQKKYSTNDPKIINQQATVLNVFCVNPDWQRNQSNTQFSECNATLGIVFNGRTYTNNLNIVSNKNDSPLKINDTIPVFINPYNPSDFRAVDKESISKQNQKRVSKTIFYILLSLSMLFLVSGVLYGLL